MWKTFVRSALAVTAAVATWPALAGSVTGTAMYRERIALPPDAVFEAWLQDVSRAGAPALLISRAVLDPAGQTPFHFEITYDDRAIVAGHRYAVRATVRHQGRLLFTTDTHVPALDGSGAPLQLRLVSASASTRRPPTVNPVSAPQATTSAGLPQAVVPDSPLRNTYWKLVRLNGAPVTVADQQREPHLIFSASEPRLSGSGGCNGVMGGFEVEGEQLRFQHMASTMMACAQGMEQETQFLRALATVVRHRIHGSRLEMLDARGIIVARFEAVALR